jgi:tRNA modification GTPase
VIKVSALNRVGIVDLETAIVANACHDQKIEPHGLLVSNLRHIQALEGCLTSLENGQKILKEGVSLEFISEEIKLAVNYLDSITGRNIDADLLENIFSQFCIGK